MDTKNLELAGAVLYKCEGAKLRKDKRYPNGKTVYYSIEFTNSEKYLIKLFLEFLRKIIGVEENKLRCELFLYADMNIEAVERKWQNVVQIPKTQFHKTIIFKTKVSRFKPNPLGTCKIRYTSKEKYIELNRIIIKKLGLAASLIK
jgi:hypothetical protein